MTKVVINTSTGNLFSLSDEALYEYQRILGIPTEIPRQGYDIARHDPVLVEIVERMGQAAAGPGAILKVKEIDGNEYTIVNSYDSEVVLEPNDFVWVDTEWEKAAVDSSAGSFLGSALNHLKDRAATYDRPTGERSMERTVEAFNAITGNNLTEEHGWLMLAVLKMVRSQQGKYKSDNYEDLIAYGALLGECAAKTRK